MRKKHFSRCLAVFLAQILIVTGLPIQVSKVSAQASSSSDSKKNGYKTMQEIIDSKSSSFGINAPDDEVEFIVELEGKSLLETKTQDLSLQSFLETEKGAAALKSIDREQSTVKQQITKMRSDNLEIEYQYRTVMNGFAIKANYSDKEQLEKIPGVKNVYVAQMHEYVEPTQGYKKATHTSGAMMDSDRVNEEGYTGKNTVTAVLDTGLDVEHSAFANAPEEVRFTLGDVETAISTGNLQTNDMTADDLYYSGKIPFMYDYADRDTNVLGPENHGTHVAGSVGADCDNFSGVAPDTQLVIMKVFSDYSNGASDAWIYAALEDCVTLGVDTINMSLGSACGFTSETNSQANEVYNRVQEAGINLLCAAGNDTSATYGNLLGTDLALISNPDNGIVGSPSTFGPALSVASVNEQTVYSQYFVAGDQKILYSDGAETDELRLTSLDGQTLEYVLIPGYGDSEDFKEVDVAGKIALIERGDIAFTEKEANAKAAGAVAAIIFNNEEGELPNMQLGGVLPTVIITKANGKYLRNLEEKKISISKDFAEDMEDVTGGLMSDFSSLGVAPDLSLKPEITAPGGNVYSTLPGDQYGNMSGTSMASPHMAGAAAVMKQYVNEKFTKLTANQKQVLINQLLMSTAVPVIDSNGVAYTPRKQGSGLANVYNAVHTGAYLSVENSERTKAELKDNAEGAFSFTFTIHNFSAEALSYDVTAIPLTAKEEEVNGYKCISESSRIMAEDEFNITFSQNNVTVPAGSSVDVNVTMQLTEKGKSMLTNFTNGTFLDGFIKLESKNSDGINLSLPYLAFYGDWSQAPIFDSTMYDDEEASMYDGFLALLDLDGSGTILGVNPLSSADTIVADANKNAIASRQLGFKSVYSILGLLRAPKKMEYTVTDVNGDVVFSTSDYEDMKSFYHAGAGFILYDMALDGWVPISLDDEGYWSYLPDGQYTYTVTGQIDGTDDKQSISFPIALDNETPSVVSTHYIVEDGVPYLEVTVKDNRHVMGLQLVNVDGEALCNPIMVDEDEAGVETTVRIDLTEAQAEGEKLGQIIVLDYAQNMVQSEVISLTSEDIEPIEVLIIQQQISAIEGLTFELEARVYPENAKDKSVTWSSNNPEVASITENGILTTNSAGKATITATAWNGVYGTTEITVRSEISTWPSDNVITVDGNYVIPANLNADVIIKDTARNVTLVGNTENTKENPYKNLSISSEGSGLNLKIDNLNAELSSSANKGIINFEGTDNTLTLGGESSLKNALYSSKALINVPETASLTVGGTGTLNLETNAGTYGAGIGSAAGQMAGTITVNSGTFNLNCMGEGAGIGGGSNSGVTKVVINGGVFDIKLPLVDTYPSNLNSCGAGIGGGCRTSSKALAIIEINGGEIFGTTEVSAAIIGTGHYSQIRPNITINDGTLNLESKNPSGKLAGGACIGTGEQSTASPKITINGGEIIASSGSQAAAIGGGSGASGGNITITGGTVTANTSDKGAAIGGGYYGSAGNIRINAGTVKATTTGAGAAIGNGSGVTDKFTIVNADSDPVFKTELYAPDVKSVTVDGVDWKVSKNHPEDETIYIWLTADKNSHMVLVETSEGTIKYEVVVLPDGKTQINQYFDVTYNLTDITTDAPKTVNKGDTLQGTLTASGDLVLPEKIQVTMDGENVEFTYNSETGEFAIENINGDIQLTAAASAAAPKVFAVETVLDHLSYDGNVTVTEGENLNAVIRADEGYDLPQTILVTMDGTTDPVYSYDASTGALFVENVRGNLSIHASGVLKKFAVNYALTNLTTDGPNTVDYGTSLRFTLQPSDGFKLPETISIVMGDVETEYSYDPMTGVVEIANVVADVAVHADAIIVVDKSALKVLLDEALAMDGSVYTPASYELFMEAIANAKAVYENQDSSQNNVDAACAALLTAKSALVEKATDEQLANIEKNCDEIKNLDRSKYSEDQLKQLDEMLNALEKALADENLSKEDAAELIENFETNIQGIIDNPAGENGSESDPSDESGSESDPSDESSSESNPSDESTSESNTDDDSVTPPTGDMAPYGLVVLIVVSGLLAIFTRKRKSLN